MVGGGPGAIVGVPDAAVAARRDDNRAEDNDVRIRSASVRCRNHWRRTLRCSVCAGGGTVDPGRDDPRVEHGVHRRHGRQRRAAGAAARSQRDARRRAMGRRGLSRCFSPRCCWPAALRAIDSAGGASSLLGVALFALPRSGAGSRQRPRADPRARAAGHRRRAARAGQPRDHQRLVRRSTSAARRSAPGPAPRAITAALGPVLGGWLIDHLSWRAAFFINVPLAVVAIAIALRHVPESRNAGSRRSLDWPAHCWRRSGSAASSTASSNRRTQAGYDPRSSRRSRWASLALAAFVAVEMHRAAPMLPLQLFRSTHFHRRQPADVPALRSARRKPLLRSART